MLFDNYSAIGSIDSNDFEHRIAKIAKKIGAHAIFNTKALIHIIEQEYCFPKPNRTIIWRYIFRLPMNVDLYSTIASQPIHSLVRNITSRIPIKFSSISNRLIRTLSCLVYWHPPLAECEWLPALVFPFLKIFERDSLISFEFIMTIILNWCSEWLNFIPNPPITILSRIDHIANEFGGKAPLSVAWPVLRSFFGEVATTDACIMIIDNIICSRPVFIEYLVASYCLMKSSHIVDFTNVNQLIRRARTMFKKDVSMNPNQSKFCPLPRDHYPLLPIVQKSPLWREKELQRIRDESEATKKTFDMVAEIEKEAATINRQRENWLKERMFLREIEDEQILEYHRSEKERLLKENIAEAANLEERKAKITERETEDHYQLDKCRFDSQALVDEMTNVSETRKELWNEWMNLKEEDAQITKEEVNTELKIIKEKEQIENKEMKNHEIEISNIAKDEQTFLDNMIRRKAEIDEEKTNLRSTLDKARRRYSEKTKLRKIKNEKNSSSIDCLA